jgi:hypothetical protein
MRSRCFIAVCLILVSIPITAEALPRLRRSAGRGSSATLRKRLHINDLITEPGTVEMDWANQYSFTTSTFTMPSSLKFTPEGNSLLWGRTEYSIAFDSVSSEVDSGTRSFQFSDRLTLTGTSILWDTTHFDLAIAPQATVFLRDTPGGLYGATVIAREDIGRNSVGATISWSGATNSSTSNPAGTWDFGAGYGRQLSANGFWGHFTPHVNGVLERSTGYEKTFSAYVGMEYQITDRIALDASGQRIGSTSGGDRQVLLGMTINLGKPHLGQ